VFRDPGNAQKCASARRIVTMVGGDNMHRSGMVGYDILNRSVGPVLVQTLCLRAGAVMSFFLAVAGVMRFLRHVSHWVSVLMVCLPS